MHFYLPRIVIVVWAWGYSQKINQSLKHKHQQTCVWNTERPIAVYRTGLSPIFANEEQKIEIIISLAIRLFTIDCLHTISLYFISFYFSFLFIRPKDVYYFWKKMFPNFIHIQKQYFSYNCGRSWKPGKQGAHIFEIPSTSQSSPTLSFLSSFPLIIPNFF